MPQNENSKDKGKEGGNRFGDISLTHIFIVHVCLYIYIYSRNVSLISFFGDLFWGALSVCLSVASLCLCPCPPFWNCFHSEHRVNATTGVIYFQCSITKAISLPAIYMSLCSYHFVLCQHLLELVTWIMVSLSVINPKSSQHASVILFCENIFLFINYTHFQIFNETSNYGMEKILSLNFHKFNIFYCKKGKIEPFWKIGHFQKEGKLDIYFKKGENFERFNFRELQI